VLNQYTEETSSMDPCHTKNTSQSANTIQCSTISQNFSRRQNLMDKFETDHQSYTKTPQEYYNTTSHTNPQGLLNFLLNYNNKLMHLFIVNQF